MKYHNKKDIRGDKSFASKGEAGLYDHLLMREKAGEISDIKTQVQVYLTDAKILYKPDFSYIENGKIRFAEFKGFECGIWRIKRRLWKFYGPAPLEVYKGTYPRLKITEVIEPCQR